MSDAGRDSGSVISRADAPGSPNHPGGITGPGQWASVGGAPGKLVTAIRRTGCCISLGLEPLAARLPAGVEPTVAAHGRYLRAMIKATADLVPAFKPNLAFFEALGPDGWRLLHDVFAAIPDASFGIADAKRGDIGSSAERYASAVFDGLSADAVTVNPLMGRDAVEPFLAHAGRMVYVLCLTSNPGAADFLTRDDLFLQIAQSLGGWKGEAHRGLVVGATAPAERLTQLAQVAGGVPLLVPGVGAQGGEVTSLVSVFGRPADTASLVHVTRAVLPTAEAAPREPEAYAAAVRERVISFIADLHGSSEGATGA